MARALFPDGSVPEPIEVARIASNLFAAGQETTVRLIATALRRIAEEPEIQAQLRANRDLVPRFIEETLRTEGPILGDYRLAIKTTELGGVHLPAGTPVLLVNGAANRDPRQFECPAEFRVTYLAGNTTQLFLSPSRTLATASLLLSCSFLFSFFSDF